jgi:flagellar M-ring protein FliF
MPFSKRATLISVVVFVVTGFVVMFIWANQVDFQPLYMNLSPEDASDIVSKLKEERVSYKLKGNGSIVLAPSDQIYELRLNLASKGLPRGGSVGFEIFDHTDFNTTEFVQRLNYQRALQGELVRTINQFKEVINSRVLIVFPRESLFVEDIQPPSASILLNLRSPLSPDKVTSIVHLVACAVEGLTTEHITVADTTGKTLFKGGGPDENGLLAGAKLDYQRKFEKTISDRVQSMLDAVLGGDKAIVRVSAEMDFNKIETSEEIYDPDSAVVRSRQHQVESSERNNANAKQSADKTKEENVNEILNYEINRLNRHTVRPFGTLTRLSVAVVLDGTYSTIKGEDDVEKKQYIPRAPEELKKFETIVSKAIGYNPDRGDQITVTSFPFAKSAEMENMIESLPIDWLGYARQYARTVINLFLAFVVFIFVVRPLLKSMKGIKVTEYVKQQRLSSPPTEGKMEELEFFTESPEMQLRESVARLAKSNPERSHQLLRGWVNKE